MSAEQLERALEQVRQQVTQQVAQRLDERQATAHQQLASMLDEQLKALTSALQNRQPGPVEVPMKRVVVPGVPADPASQASGQAPDPGGHILQIARRGWRILEEVQQRPQVLGRRRLLGRFR